VTTIAFIGLGIMGAPMAGHLIDAGHDVVGYNRSRPAVDRLVERGGRAASSVADAVRGAEVVITMVPDSPDVEQVALGDEGVYAAAKPGTLHIDCSTIRPDVARALAGVPDGEPVMALAHDPDVFPFVPARVALTVCGHTHGGQVAIPYARIPFLLPSRHGERLARGHIVEHGRHLFVGAGLGTSGLPVRLLAPPEVVVLELRSG
jgi:predicted MPP superfamily phosphohydrolase